MIFKYSFIKISLLTILASLFMEMGFKYFTIGAIFLIVIVLSTLFFDYVDPKKSVKYKEY
jgi:hypothetical protein